MKTVRRADSACPEFSATNETRQKMCLFLFVAKNIRLPVVIETDFEYPDY
jgi:hypothetical protein